MKVNDITVLNLIAMGAESVMWAESVLWAEFTPMYELLSHRTMFLCPWTMKHMVTIKLAILKKIETIV